LDPDEVQARFVALSAEAHPDRVHNAAPEVKAACHERFAALNAACSCLRDPRERLRHLLELERGVKPNQLERLPSAAVDLYFQLGQTCRQVDQFVTEKARASSPLLKVQLFERALAWIDELRSFEEKLNRQRAEVEATLKDLNAVWRLAREVGTSNRALALPLDQLEQSYRELSYILRWSEQIRERVLELSF
jgi:hypothetical protein